MLLYHHLTFFGGGVYFYLLERERQTECTGMGNCRGTGRGGLPAKQGIPESQDHNQSWERQTHIQKTNADAHHLTFTDIHQAISNNTQHNLEAVVNK